MTDPVGWKRVEELYHGALARDERDRSAFLRESCAGDPVLLREVESLLSYATETREFMQRPAIDVAAGVFPPHSPERQWMLAAGVRLGPYTIVAPLGAGGMGEVYRGHDERLGRDIAIKVLPAHVTRDAAAVDRFSREARAASALNHPNIVTIHEIGVADDAGRFIVMELVQGTTLRSMIPCEFAVQAFANLGSQIAKALAVAHVAGIIHRDVKPENVMVRDDGYVKLLDFGLARLIDQDRDDDIRAGAATRVALGTFRYMSPEQLRCSALTAATDVFSLGIVFYELATGQRPFSAGSDAALLQSMLHDAAVPPSQVNAAIPRMLDVLILHMLKKEAHDRPTALEVETTLAELGGRRVRPAGAVVAPDRRHVGRTSERRELHEAFEMSLGGPGLLVAVAGESGIGKTTLVEDFLCELEVESPSSRIARGRCSERLAGTGAYLPWLEAFDSLLHRPGHELATRLMKSLAPTWYRQVAPPAASSSPVSAEATSPEDMKRELVALLQELTRASPMVLFFDDVHWADASTMDLIAYVAARFDLLPVLIVATYRPSETLLARHPFLAVRLELLKRGVCREMPLGFLTREDVDAFLTFEFPIHDFPADLPALIHAKTEGHPLFMADMVRHLRDSHAIREEHGRWISAVSLPDIQRELPVSVRSMIRQKIGQLGDADLRLLATASVQGCEFDAAVVADAVHRDAADVEERLEVLDRVHCLVRLVDERELPDHTMTLRYRFVHVLYQNALYDSLQPSRRASLSAAVADALLVHHGERRHALASELAMLFNAARDFGRAAEYYDIAAEQAIQMYAMKEAAALARQGLEAAAHLREPSDRAQRQLRLQTALGTSLMATESWGAAEAEEIHLQALELHREVGDTSQLFPILWGHWQYRLGRADYRGARDFARRLTALATELAEDQFRLLAHQAMAQTNWLSGEVASVVGSAESAIALYVPERHHVLAASYGGHDPGVASRSCLALNLWIHGRPEQAGRTSEDAIALARRLDHRYSLVFALLFDAMLQKQCREPERACQQTDAAIELAKDQPWWAAVLRSWAAALRGWALAQQDRPDEGIARLRDAIAEFRRARFESLLPYFLGLLAESYAAAGDCDAALRTVDEALAITEETREGYVEAELHRLKGEWLEDSTMKEACFLRARDAARRRHATSYELRAAMSMSRLDAAHGRRDQARRTLTEVYRSFAEGFDSRDLRDAASLLQSL
jgi:adenylate cyclase